MKNQQLTRRKLLKRAGYLGAGLAVFPFGCKEAIPDDVRITRIIKMNIPTYRPKYVGKNSRIDDHTDQSIERAIRVYTSNGLDGIGVHWGDEAALQPLIGKSLSEWYDAEANAVTIDNRGTTAFWDILGKHYEKPVWQLLGEAQRELVPQYDGTIYFQDLIPEYADNYMDQFKKEFDMGQEMGHNFFKMKVGRGHRWMEKEAGYVRDIQVLAACREYIGPDIRIGVDANNGLDLEQTKQMLKDLPDFDFEFMEEMFPEEVALDKELHDFIKEGGWDTLVADFESQKEVEAFRPFMEAGCIDVLQGDMNQFGVEGILAEAALAKPFGGRVAPHNWGSLLGYYIQLHLGKVIENWYCAEHDALTTPAITPMGFEMSDGMTTVTDEPGLGLKINEEKLEKEAEIIFDLS